MANTTEGRIFEALMSRAAGLTSIGLPIAWPNVDFSPPASKKYLRVQHVPNTTARMQINSDGAHRYLGMLQVSVFWPKGQGETEPREIAGQVVDHFPCDLILVESDVEVRITERPNVADLIVESDRVMVPVTAEWECYH